MHCEDCIAITASSWYNNPSLPRLLVSCLLLCSSGPPCMYEWTTSMSSPLCLLSVAMRLRSQKGVCLTESCAWRPWMPTAPRSTARFASMTSSLPMCPSPLITTVRYVLSCAKSKAVGLKETYSFLSLCATTHHIILICCLHYLFWMALVASKITKSNIQFGIRLQILNTWKTHIRHCWDIDICIATEWKELQVLNSSHR